MELFFDLKIDFNGSRVYFENYVENYIVEDGFYELLILNIFGNFNIFILLIKIVFSKSDENGFVVFDDFRVNWSVIVDCLVRELD